MSEFHDSEMEHLLGRAGGPFPDVNVAYRTVQGRVRRAQRRRALATSGVAFSLLLGVGALAVSRSGGSQTVQPGDGGAVSSDGRLQPDTTIAVTTTVPSTTALATTVATTIEPATTAAPVVPADTGGATPTLPAGTPGTAAPKTTAPKTTAPKTTAPKTTTPTTPATTAPAGPVDDGGATTATPPSTAPKSAALPVTATFSGVGGSIVVRMEGDRLTLVSFQAADGFQPEVRRQSGGHVEVRFDSGSHRTVARVDLEQGTMVQHFDESDS